MLPHLERALEQLLVDIELIPLMVYGRKLRESMQCVSDESDSPFAALSLARPPSIIVTYNKRHFKSRRLSRHKIRVLTPVETVNAVTMKRINFPDVTRQRM